jgi:hypothetical protein
MKGVIQKLPSENIFRGKNNCLIFSGMYQPALCPKLLCPLLSLVCKSRHQRERGREREGEGEREREREREREGGRERESYKAPLEQ